MSTTSQSGRVLRTATPFVDPLGPTSVQHAPVIQTAGAVVWRIRHDRLQVQLVHRPRYDDWSWPKGKHEEGESLATTAVREVTEETGKPVVLGLPLPGLQYLTPEGRVKRVHYWAARRASAKHDSRALAARTPVAPASKREIDKAEWLDAEDAAERLTRSTDRGPLDALVEAHRDGQLATHAVVIVRHGRALPRANWYGVEQDRPLTPLGHGQAAALVPVLASYGVDAVISSRWERCATTIDPYVRAANLRPEYSDNLGEAQHERSPARVAAAVRDLLEADRASVLCTHRPVLPTVLDVLGQHSSRSVASTLPRRDPYLEPGEALVAHVARTPKGPKVVAAERVAPQVF
ncbi:MULTISPECIES: NUDIX hydrolase [unclassified Isoptericola]|uniref:NUDIX hydrolase n=1 Tax=unclassified Isoptericola TaxID=2623355 RepID=UPI00271251B2|nr:MULTISPECIES: NUDIX hydrolase [unclassified Isoptericola]MDO8143391.1 NUDIX hydrolase [Isoptericola sp. 178]MDO8147254.1 NUDIX hydrolase [Isoptericola sp. b515]MDO8150433.1 NUDIX hydrolase [Isoptericola sp. b408]